MTDVPIIHATTRERFRSLAKQILQKRSREQLKLQPWLVVLWPWSWIGKRPALRSLVFTTVLVLAVLAVGAGSWSALFVAKVFLTGSVLYIALLGLFVVTGIYQRLYVRLRRVALMPEDALERWYLARVSSLLGHANLYAPTSRYDFRQSLREDSALWALYAVNLCLGISGSLYYCNARADAGGHLLSIPAWIGLAALNVATVLSTSWTVPHALLTVRFPLELARLPVRSYPRMPGSVSLNVVGDAFLLTSSLYTAMFLPCMALLFVCGVRPDVVTLSLASIYSFVLISGGMISQLALAIALYGHRQKKLVEYGFHVEQAFEQFMKNPLPELHARLKELLLQRKVIRTLPATGFSLWSGIGFVLLGTLNVSMLLFFWYFCGSVPRLLR